MALEFVVETGAGDSDATSYVSLAYANDYIETNSYQAAAWMALSDSDKQNLLIRASKVFDARIKWDGERVDQDSGLKWPRHGVFSDDNFLIPDDVIPQILQDATCEFAGYLTSDDWTAPRAEDQFRELRIDVIDIKFNQDYRRAFLPDLIIQMLSPLGAVNAGKRPGFKKVIRS